MDPASYTILRSHHQPRPRYNYALGSSSVMLYCFFRAGELSLPSQKDFQPWKNLCWRDVTVDNTQAPNVLKVHLKHFKTDQLGQGIEVYEGKTGCCKLCPAAAVSAYMVSRGNQAGPFLKFQDGTPLTKAPFTFLIIGRHYLRLQFLYWGGNCGSMSRD